jgi:mannose-6-phosphate isomerase-like protein (cupin superfamily)
MRPILRRPGEGETTDDRAERTVRLLLDEPQLAVSWSRYAPSERGPEPHVHREHVDAFYVLDGELIFAFGPEQVEAGAPAGTFVSVPQNVVHSFRSSDVETTFLNLHAPNAGFAGWLRDESAPWDSHVVPADGGRPAAEARLWRDEERYEFDDRIRTVKADLPEISSIELVVGDGWDGIAPHTHGAFLDSFYVLAGEVAFVVGDSEVRAGAGTYTAAPPRARHGIRSLGVAARLLNVHAPDGGFVERLRRG